MVVVVSVSVKVVVFLRPHTTRSSGPAMKSHSTSKKWRLRKDSEERSSAGRPKAHSSENSRVRGVSVVLVAVLVVARAGISKVSDELMLINQALTVDLSSAKALSAKHSRQSSGI